MARPLRIGLLGAGYIASWHADAIRATPGIELVAVCDRSAAAAEGLAAGYGIRAYTDLEQLIADGVCDAVHILTPPPSHRALAERCLGGGLHVLVEKPAALSLAELDAMTAAAEAAGRSLGVCHNFLALPGYQRLKRAFDAGDLGLVSAVQINWSLPLAPLRSGPYGLWLLAETRNLLLELGPHPFAFATDLCGPLEIEHVSLNQWITLPGGDPRPQSWRILARAGRVDVTIALSLVETIEDRSVSVRGSSGLARLDYGADSLVVTRDNTAELVLNPLRKGLGQAGGYLREALVNGWRQGRSLNQHSPYGLSFRNTLAGFYDGLAAGRPDPRFAPAQVRQVMAGIADTLAALPPLPVAPARPVAPPDAPAPDVMVIGGTGFIGRDLTRALVAQGHRVRVLSRGEQSPFADIADRVELVGVSLRDAAALQAAMAGITCVYNLARSHDRTWEEALANDVATALRISRAARAAGVRRMVYTGTIASYDMSDPGATITEATPFGEMAARNLYARSKAECERQLLAAAADGTGVEVVIARPGIVLGDGGPLQHWGIGRWHGPGAVRLWGSGRNILPFVLVGDVSTAMIAMGAQDGIGGEDFNLIGPPMLTGRDYFDAIHRRLGARLGVTGSNLDLLWLADLGKQALKRHLLRRRDAVAPIRADWRSRGHLARFDNAKPCRVLGWQPQGDRDAFLRQAIDEAHLFW